MNKFDHTPEPWHTAEYDDDENEGQKIGVYAFRWTEADRLGDPGEEVIIADVTQEDVDWTEFLGNVRLIAFAPEMFDLLVQAEHDLRQGAMPSSEWLETAKQIIANVAMKGGQA